MPKNVYNNIVNLIDLIKTLTEKHKNDSVISDF